MSASVQKNVWIVVASLNNGGIGFQGKLPWQVQEDMKFFRTLTTETKDNTLRNAVVMGRNTWNSIPERFRPLAGRLNVVVSRAAVDPSYPSVVVQPSWEEARKFLEDAPDIETIYVIGGAQLYREVAGDPKCSGAYHTRLMFAHPPPTDVSFDPLPCPDQFDVQSLGTFFRPECAGEFLWYKRKPETERPHEEQQYLKLIQTILQQGKFRVDRTGTCTYSVFGERTRWDLRNSTLPLLTTKKVFWKGVAAELLWMISGSTNGNLLSAQGVRIWDGNGSREALDRLGLHHREVGDLGPIYGFQWRHFGASYQTMHTDYQGTGVDQLQRLIQLIKTNPTDRRLILNSWNVTDLPSMALPPCHVMCQFYVEGNYLSCQMYQRSADVGLGVPFNIASYALLTHMIAHVCGLEAKELIHIMGDTHIYSNHVEALKQQIKRTPYPFPQLRFVRPVESIDDFQLSDFQLENYRHHESLPMPMAV